MKNEKTLNERLLLIYLKYAIQALERIVQLEGNSQRPGGSQSTTGAIAQSASEFLKQQLEKTYEGDIRV